MKRFSQFVRAFLHVSVVPALAMPKPNLGFLMADDVGPRTSFVTVGQWGEGPPVFAVAMKKVG